MVAMSDLPINDAMLRRQLRVVPGKAEALKGQLGLISSLAQSAEQLVTLQAEQKHCRLNKNMEQKHAELHLLRMSQTPQETIAKIGLCDLFCTGSNDVDGVKTTQQQAGEEKRAKLIQLEDAQLREEGANAYNSSNGRILCVLTVFVGTGVQSLIVYS